jgi:hypothetical protein
MRYPSATNWTDRGWKSTNRENWLLLTDELVEFEK